jgi:8-oxo-dGTP pyrophosphatase MutT (NUDIX family)
MDPILARILEMVLKPLEGGRCGSPEYDASVAVIYEEPSRSIILIERVERPGDPWSGHIAFPGGFRKPGEDSYETAVREAWEEIHIDLRRAFHLGDIGIWLTRGSVRVVPHIFVSKEVLDAKPGEEVSRILKAVISEIEEIECPQNISRAPCLRVPGVEGKVIWGLTARIVEWLMRHERSEW